VLQTEDLFLASYGLTRGGALARIEVQSVNGRRLAFFHIVGPGMEEVARDYYGVGPALVQLRLLKAEVTRLKNLAFFALRQEESRHEREQGNGRAYPSGEPHRRAGR
jgi:hypothetical protein